MFTKKIGIDLGTANTLVYVPKKGVVIQEPTVVAVSLLDNKILAVGEKAKEMLGKVPDTIIVSKPMKDGVIANFRVTEAMLRYFIDKALGKIRFIKPEVMISVPAGITSTERRAVIEAAIKAGAKAAYVIKEPILAAIGAGLKINEPSGHMIVNIGGGTTEVAVISLGGIITSLSIRMGGNKIDEAIGDYIKKKYNLAIGERTAEQIKFDIGSALINKEEEVEHPQEEKVKEIRARDLVSGLPKIITLNSEEITRAISDPLSEIIQAIKTVLSQTPPELIGDILDKGIILSGGGALLKNIDHLIFQTTGVECHIATDPMLCVARGTGIALEHLDIYKKSIFSKPR